RFDPAANGGQGGWVMLGEKVGSIGQHPTSPILVNTTAGPVVAWLDAATGSPQIYLRRFTGGSWQALGAGSDTGGGISMGAERVQDLAIATDGTRVAMAWAQDHLNSLQVYLREFDGASWVERSGSATGMGVSAFQSEKTSPSVAYHEGQLFVAWKAFDA